MRDGAFVCSICGQKSTGYPNNAEPVVKKGWCCDDCNTKTVMPERISQMMASGPQTDRFTNSIGFRIRSRFPIFESKGEIS